MGETDISVQIQEAGSKKWDDRTLAQKAADMAQTIHTESIRRLKSDERTLLSALSRLAADEKNRDFLRRFCADVLHAPRELQPGNLRDLITAFGGVPSFFGTMARLRFRAAAAAVGSIQSAAMAEVRRIFRSTFGELTMPTDDKGSRYLRDLSADNLTPALQPLTPAVFGKKGAARYTETLTDIASHHPSIGVVIEPLRLIPNLSPHSPGAGATALSNALIPLLQKLTAQGNNRPIVIPASDSSLISITLEGCKRALSDKKLLQANVIVELPAYLNAAPTLLRELTEWATARAKKGATPLKVMLTKGSALSRERECAFIYGRDTAAAPNKAATESRYKQLVHQAISAKKNALCPVIATHNPFDLAYALLDWARSGREGLPPCVFRAGLGNHTGRLLSAHGAEVVLTVGTAEEEGDMYGFEGYLLALVNELSRPEGYLTHGYAADPGEMGWARMRQHFLAALSGREESPGDGAAQSATGFIGGTLQCTDRAATEGFYAAAASEVERTQSPLALTIGDKPVDTPLMCIHRSLITPGGVDYKFTSADFGCVADVIHRAVVATGQESFTEEERLNSLLKLARRLDKNRTELAALLVRDAGFTYADAETEIRDAIDAARFYEQSATADGLRDGTTPEPLGVVVVAPGNIHPLAEAIAGISAAWAMGNSIIYKPAAYTTLLGHKLIELLREVGMTDPQLQLLPCLDNEIALKLMTSPHVNGVITGLGYDFAHRVATENPTATLCCTPGGAASVYISARSDWQQAIRDLCPAAFRRSGQSYTAPHVLLVHAEVYDNHHFINSLKDAVSSLHAAPGCREGADLGTLAAPLTIEQNNLLSISGDNGGALNWVIKPSIQEIGSIAWHPGIITGVTTSDKQLLRTIGTLPVIALIRVESTTSAAAMQREISAGQAAAIYTTDEADATAWQNNLADLAHLCINCCPAARPGLRPYGTAAPALLGAAPLPGGSNYLTALANWQETARPQRRGRQRNMPFNPWETLIPKPAPDDTMRLTNAADSISYWWENEFGTGRIICDQPGEPTELSYSPLTICLRAEKETANTDLAIALMAALKAGCKVILSTATMRPWMPRTLQELGVPARVENRDEFEYRFPSLAADGIVVRDPAADDRAVSIAAACGLRLSRASVVANGRLELLQCLQEHTITRRTNTRYTPL